MPLPISLYLLIYLHLFPVLLLNSSRPPCALSPLLYIPLCELSSPSAPLCSPSALWPLILASSSINVTPPVTFNPGKPARVWRADLRMIWHCFKSHCVFWFFFYSIRENTYCQHAFLKHSFLYCCRSLLRGRAVKNLDTPEGCFLLVH